MNERASASAKRKPYDYDLANAQMNEPQPRAGYLENGGTRLSYVEWGDGARRPPMLLLHGMRDCARSWDAFAMSMSADFRVIALDSRGHGDSDRAPPGGYRFSDHVSDVAAAVDGLGLRNPVIVGHSAGGRYAWRYAADNPDRVRALIVVDIDPDPFNPQTARDFAQIADEPDVYPDVGRFVERLRERQPYTDADTLARQARFLSKPAPNGGAAWKADIRIVTEYERPDLWDSWRGIACPVLLVRGRQSRLLTHETAVRMREALPAAQVRLAELEGGGHWFHQDFPGAFEATARWFLSGLDLSGG